MDSAYVYMCIYKNEPETDIADIDKEKSVFGRQTVSFHFRCFCFLAVHVRWSSVDTRISISLAFEIVEPWSPLEPFNLSPTLVELFSGKSGESAETCVVSYSDLLFSDDICKNGWLDMLPTDCMRFLWTESWFVRSLFCWVKSDRINISSQIRCTCSPRVI